MSGQAFTQKEAIRVRNDRERRYGTLDMVYVVERVGRGKWVVRRRQRPVGLRRMFGK